MLSSDWLAEWVERVHRCVLDRHHNVDGFESAWRCGRKKVTMTIDKIPRAGIIQSISRIIRWGEASIALIDTRLAFVHDKWLKLLECAFELIKRFKVLLSYMINCLKCTFDVRIWTATKWCRMSQWQARTRMFLPVHVSDNNWVNFSTSGAWF